MRIRGRKYIINGSYFGSSTKTRLILRPGLLLAAIDKKKGEGAKAKADNWTFLFECQNNYRKTAKL